MLTKGLTGTIVSVRQELFKLVAFSSFSKK